MPKDATVRERMRIVSKHLGSPSAAINPCDLFSRDYPLELELDGESDVEPLPALDASVTTGCDGALPLDPVSGAACDCSAGFPRLP